MVAAHYLDAYRAAQEDSDAQALRVKSLAALRRAAQRAATVGAPEIAERSYQTAVELAREDVERAELTRAEGEMALQAGRLARALRYVSGDQIRRGVLNSGCFRAFLSFA